jgi:hypothetical protein
MCLVKYSTRARTPWQPEAFDFTGHGSRSANRTLFARTQICGVQYSLSDRFLIDTPKRLEIAVTRRKQSSQVISNRYKIAGSFEPQPRAFHAALDRISSGTLSDAARKSTHSFSTAGLMAGAPLFHFPFSRFHSVIYSRRPVKLQTCSKGARPCRSTPFSHSPNFLSLSPPVSSSLQDNLSLRLLPFRLRSDRKIR